MGDSINDHPLHARTRRVVAEGGTGGEQGVACCSVGMDDGMDRRIHTVEQPDLLRQQFMRQASG